MNKLFRCFTVTLTSAVIVFSVAGAAGSYAKTTMERLKEAQEEQKKAKEALQDAQDQVDDISNQKEALETRLSDFNDKMNALSGRLSDLEEQLSSKKDELEKTNDALDTAMEMEKNQHDALMKRIKFMYENKSTMYMSVFFSARSFSDFLTANDYIDSITEYDREKLLEYEATKEAINIIEAKLEDEESELIELKQEALDAQEDMMKLVNSTVEDVCEYGDLLDDAEKEALAREAELDAKNADVKTLQKQLEEEQRLSRLAASSRWRSIDEVSFVEGDRKLLANLIYCEAGAEPYDGKVAVGSVVINRVMSSIFPDTLSGVVYQRSQFSPVASGRLEYAMAMDKANADCYRAADEAMSGYTNVGSCLFFRTPVPGLNGTMIGNHIFY